MGCYYLDFYSHIISYYNKVWYLLFQQLFHNKSKLKLYVGMFPMQLANSGINVIDSPVHFLTTKFYNLLFWWEAHKNS